MSEPEPKKSPKILAGTKAGGRRPAQGRRGNNVETDVDPTQLIVNGLRQLLRKGLPVRPETAPKALLDLPSVIARSVDPTDLAARADALERLIRSQLATIGLSDLKSAAKVLFGIGALGTSLTDRREFAAERSDYNVDHFRKRVEPKIIQQLAWQITRDGLQYRSRTYGAEPLAASGSTPTIQPEHVDSLEQAEREILTSRIWSDVYGLRAELIRREAAKIPGAQDEASNAGESKEELAKRAEDLADAETGVRWHMARLLSNLDLWMERYGHEILHGEGEFNAEALIRLAGWTGEVTDERARELRFRLRRVGEWQRAGFKSA